MVISDSDASKAKSIKDLKDRVFIVQSNKGDFLLTNVKVDIEKEEIEGILANVPALHRVYLNDEKRRFAYSKPEEPVIYEVHLYTNLKEDMEYGDKLVVPISSLYKIEVIERDKGRSTVGTVTTIIGVTVGALAVMAAIVALTKSSCPYISVFDGENYLLQGETFGGAIYPSLEREDYVPLPMILVGEEIRLQISNELLEKQYTDIADILLVNHGPNDKILISPEGQMFEISRQIQAKHALLNNSINVLPSLLYTDNVACGFDDRHQQHPVNELVVQFDDIPGESQLGLILDLRNSYWLDYLFEEFSKNFGKHFTSWREKQKDKPATEMNQWKEDNQIPLSILVKTKQGWQELTKLNTIGPLMNRELLVPLGDLDLDSGDLKIALKTGFLFWELDRLELAEIKPVSDDQRIVLKPVEAIDENGKDVLGPLLQMDRDYLAQLEIGNRAFIKYYFQDFNPQLHYSAFLFTKGYYEPIRDFQGPMNRKFLTKFRNPGEFTKFSLVSYQKLIEYSYAQAR